MKITALRTIITWLYLGCFVGSLGKANDTGLTLPEDVMPQLKPLLAQAMRQSPRLLERNLDLAQRKAEAYVTRAASLPQIGGFAQYQYRGEKRLDEKDKGIIASDRYYYAVAATQSVWQWGALEASRKIARIDQELAEVNYANAYRLLAAEVRASYMHLVLGKISLGNAAHYVRMAQAELVRLEARFKAGEISDGGVQGGQLKLAGALLAERRARADFEHALKAFGALIGNREITESDIPDQVGEIVQAPVVPDLVASSAANEANGIRAAEKEVAKARLAMIGPRVSLYPKFSVVAALQREELQRDIDLNKKYQVDTGYIGLQVDWAIFDGFRAKGQQLAATTQLRRAEHRLTRLREAAAGELGRDRQNLDFTWEAYRIEKGQFTMVQAGTEYAGLQFKRGAISQEQLDGAVAGLNAHLYSTQEALVAHLNAAVQYLVSQGLDPFGKPEDHP